MTWLDKLERRFGRVAVPNLIYWIVIGQILFYGLGLFTNFPVGARTLKPAGIMQGEVWRLVTFLFVPEIRQISIWIVFAWLLLMLYGRELEAVWGNFRFNLFVFIGTAATALAALVGYFIQPHPYELPNWYLLTSLFLAFAALNPDFQLMLFFVLPVKVKWLAWFVWALFAYNFLLGPIQIKLLVAAACVNLVLFFGKGLFQNAQATQRRRKFQKTQMAEAEAPFHTCIICGLTDHDDPDMDFIYANGEGYCRDHAQLADASPEEQARARAASPPRLRP